jgi:TP901 family phage tail tape measure protein
MPETIWVFEIDGSPAVASAEEIAASIDAIGASIAAVVSAAGDLTGLDDALSGVASISADAQAQIDGLTSAMASMSSTIAEDTAIIDGLNATVANLEAQLAALTGEFDSAGGMAAMFSGMLAGAGESLSALGESLSAAQGPLMMLSMAGVMMGKSLFDSGIQGQQGIELVKGMAGATNQDVQNLQQSAMSLGDTMQEATAGFYQVASAGYTGADATKVFTAATEAAKGAQTALQPVSTALTSIMAAYGDNADQAKTRTDQMTEAVFVGRQSFDAFASAIGPLAATGHNVGLSFAEVAAAEATMTQTNSNVRRDTMQLNSLFTNMDMSMDKVAQTAKKEKLAFDETHYASLNLIDKLRYLADISGGTNTVAFQKMVGGINGVKASLALLGNQGNTYTSDLQKIQNSQGATDAKFAESETTIKAHMDHIGAAFSLFSTKFMDALGPKLIPVLDAVGSAIGKMTDFMTAHMDIVMPVLAGLAVMFGTILVSAVVALTISVWGLIWPFLAIGAAVGAVVAVVIMAFTHWGQITDWLRGVWQGFSSWFMGLMGGIGAFFTGVWQGISSHFMDIVQGISSHAQSAWADVQSKAQSAWAGITSTVQKGGQDLLSRWNDIWSSFSHSAIGGSIIKTLQDQLAPIGQQFGQIGTMLRTQLGAAIAGVMPALSNLGDSFKLIWNDISQIAGTIGGAFMQSQKALQQAFSQVDQAIGKIPWKALLTSLEQVGSLLDGAFMAAWHALSPVFAQIGQAAGFVGQAFAFVGHILGGQFLDTLKLIGMFIGGVLLILFSVILGAIVGLLRGIATFIQGIVTVITGIVQVFSGVIQIISGIIAFFVDLVTGHFNKLGADLGVIWGGIVTLFEGVWNIIKGIFIATLGTLISIVSGFISTVIAFFANLASSVGIHVSGLVTGIINFFRDLPQNVINALDALPGMIVNLWNTIITDATNAGTNIVKGIGSGITNAIHFVTDAIGGVTKWISDHLPHSPAKEGPLKDLLLQGSLITEQISEGMLSNLPKLHSAITKLTQPITVGLAPTSLVPSQISAPQGGLGGGNDQNTYLLQQIANDIHTMAQQRGGGGNLTMNNSFGSSQMSVQQLAQAIGSALGFGYEGTARGSGGRW